jgi:hypothetical protein
MKNILLPGCFSLISLSSSGFVNGSYQERNDDLLQHHCGYHLGNSLDKTILHTESKLSEKVYSENSEIEINLDGRIVRGELHFSCFISAYDLGDQVGDGGKTASEEIEHEDSGGRYARAIAWSSEFYGSNWIGTIAYTNSIFGDGSYTPTHSFFYICPKEKASSCFSLEINSNYKLTEADSRKIPAAISDISYSSK